MKCPDCQRYIFLTDSQAKLHSIGLWPLLCSCGRWLIPVMEMRRQLFKDWIVKRRAA